jgi:hypothetical protein
MLGDDTGGVRAILPPIDFQCARGWISACLPCTNTHTHTHTQTDAVDHKNHQFFWFKIRFSEPSDMKLRLSVYLHIVEGRILSFLCF